MSSGWLPFCHPDFKKIYISIATTLHLKIVRRRRGRDRTVIGVTTTNAIGAYHH